MSHDTTTSLEILEALDFTPALPCEGRLHNEEHRGDGPAKYRIEVRHHCYPTPKRYAICETGYVDRVRYGVRCLSCSWRTPPGDPGCTILEVLS